MTTPAYRSAATDYGFGGPSSASFLKPAGTVQDDILIFHVVTANAVSPNWPSGFTPLGVANRGGFHMAAAWKRAGSSEPASWNVSLGTGSDYLTYVSAFSGASQSGSPFAAIGAMSTSANPGNVTIPGVTAPANALIVALFGVQTAQFDASPSGYVFRYNTYNGNPKHTAALATRTWTSDGATGSLLASTNASASSWPGGGIVLALAGNNPPNAPTLTTLANGETIDGTAPNRAGHAFSDPDTGDSQSAFTEYWRQIGAATWDSAYVVTPNQYYDFPADSLPVGDYERQVETYDAQGVLGARSASGFFTVATPPPAPSITDPINGQTINAATYLATFSAPNVDASQWRTVADNAGVPDTTVEYQNSGVIESTTSRSNELAFPVNNRIEHVQVRYRLNGLWSAWYSVSINVSYTEPTSPSYVKTDDPANGRLLVAITNPAPAAGEPAVSYNIVYVDDGDGRGEIRKATMLAANAVWSYDLPRSGKNYDGSDGSSIRVEAVATNGTTSSS